MSQISKCPKVTVILSYCEASGEVSKLRYESLLYSSSKRSYCSSGWETYISCPSISSSLSGNMRIYTFLKFILPRKILFLKQGWCCGGAGDRQRWIGTIHLNIIPAVREYQDMHHPEINEIYHSKENFMLETMVVLRLGYRQAAVDGKPRPGSGFASLVLRLIITVAMRLRHIYVILVSDCGRRLLLFSSRLQPQEREKEKDNEIGRKKANTESVLCMRCCLGHSSAANLFSGQDQNLPMVMLQIMLAHQRWNCVALNDPK